MEYSDDVEYLYEDSDINIFEDFVNTDIPDTNYVYILDDDEETTRPGVIITTLNTSGDLSDQCYDLDSLTTLISSLKECRQSLILMNFGEECA